MIEGILRRISDDGVQTLGELLIYSGNALVFRCKTLELSWKDNRRNVSCIPAGKYDVIKYSSEKYPEVYELQNVPSRSKILIHWGNYKGNTQGCILVGKAFADIDGDGYRDVTSSKDTISKLKATMNYSDFRLTVLEPAS